MATRYLNQKTKRFYFDDNGERKSYVLIYGDEVNTLTSPPSTPSFTSLNYRKRDGEMDNPQLTKNRSLEMYFLDVGQGDAAFIITPNGTKILVDGGLRERALGFLIWKYRLDKPNTKVTIDHLFLSHADKDHVDGLIPLVMHNKITVSNIYHNGIGLFKSGFNTPLGNRSNGKLRTVHNSLNDLRGLSLTDTFKDWTDAVSNSGANYQTLDSNQGILDIGDNDVRCEILGPVKESDGNLKWFSDKAHTINGHSLVFRLTYKHIRTFFSGDLNIKGSKHILAQQDASLKLNSHIFKAPHHGSHEFEQELFNAVNPQITVISSGEVPDHGHPRASFLGAIGLAGRGDSPLVFSTALSALFVDAGDSDHVANANIDEPTTLSDLDFSQSIHNTIARRRFKKLLPGIINIRTDGEKIYAYRRVQQGYQWESYVFNAL